jgi:hypothetical protein
MQKLRANIGWIITVVLLLGLAGIAAIRSRAVMPETTPPYTMRAVQTSYNLNGIASYKNADRVRYQRSDESWKETYTYYNPDGSIQASTATLGITGLGVFEINEKSKTLTFLGPKKHSMHREDETKLRSDPNFAREDRILGYKVIVLHSVMDNDYEDTYRAPDLGGAILKIVSGKIGSDGYTVIEATSIERGEPAESFAVPDYPFVYGFYEAQIKKEQALGHANTADQMRQIVTQHKTGKLSE